MQIAILGCGPTGLVAAHAAYQAGHDPAVFSKKRKSFIHGAQYLHAPIEGINPIGSPMKIRYVMQGEPEGYLKKVYGSKWDGSISDDLRDQEHLAWDIRAAYSWLWMHYSPYIFDQEFSADTFGNFYDDLIRCFDLVINTIPRSALCVAGHFFKSTSIWALGDAPEHGQFVPMDCNLGDVIYNGLSEPSWYRLSNIFGYKTVEWPNHGKPPVEGVSKVEKPISHNCDCWPELRHTGRFGAWNKHKMVHNSYDDVKEMIMLKEMP